ncbi:MAG TPA: hypothetical protein DD727_01400 [Clostridiales bacterium]|nr:hypothetical protein [Clostridiales bacterium]
MITCDAIEYFQETAQYILEKCRIEKWIIMDGKKCNVTLRVPSGDMKYHSFWVRDASMMASSGLIPPEEIRGWLRLIASAQNGMKNRILENGLQIPSWSIPDHINFDGKPVFYPGTYESGADQGAGHFGYYPPHDDAYYFIELAYQYLIQSGDQTIFQEQTDGVTLLERLEKACISCNIDPDSQLCCSKMPNYTVDWGFCDQIVKSGYLLFPSLLRRQAALQFAYIFTQLGDVVRTSYYLELAGKIKSGILQNLTEGNGWFLSSTEICRQKDVWGTAFAVWTGLLEGDLLQRSLQVLAEAFKAGRAVAHGYVRQILEGEEAAAGKTAWEKTECPFNTYQNGGYWTTPSGWYIYALYQHDPELARLMIQQLKDHSCVHAADGAPYEWMSRDGSVVSGRMYGASATLPFVAVKRIAQEEKPS